MSGIGKRKILIIKAGQHDDVIDNLVEGAVKEFDAEGFDFKQMTVPSVLEIPLIIRYATRAMELRATENYFSGYIVLGCLLRSDEKIYNFEHISLETIRNVQDIAMQLSLAVGNGIIIADNHKNALKLSDTNDENFGGYAARTCLNMMKAKNELGL